jgi:hypothetical protein
MAILIVVLVVVLGLMIFMWISVGREPGPGPADVAIAYERAWDDLDFDLLYELSGEEMRDGMRKPRFIAAKQAAYAGKHTRLGARVHVENSVVGHQTALIITVVDAGTAHVRNNVMLEKRSNGWVVVAYSLRPDAEADTSTP